MNRLDHALDGVLHLLDRQVVDVDGLMVGKVDDVEITEGEDGALVVTGLLCGAPVLVPRWGGDHGDLLLEKWRQLGVQKAGRTVPGRIDLGRVSELTSEVRLDVSREGVVEPQRPPGRGRHLRRLNDLLTMNVAGPPGERPGRVIDVRMEPDRADPANRIVLTALVVGRGRPGSMLGYDRQQDMGPALLARLVRHLHRHTGIASLREVDHIDWERSLVHYRGELAPLEGVGVLGS